MRKKEREKNYSLLAAFLFQPSHLSPPFRSVKKQPTLTASLTLSFSLPLSHTITLVHAECTHAHTGRRRGERVQRVIRLAAVGRTGVHNDLAVHGARGRKPLVRRLSRVCVGKRERYSERESERE